MYQNNSPALYDKVNDMTLRHCNEQNVTGYLEAIFLLTIGIK
jgi:hypothetical protein